METCPSCNAELSYLKECDGHYCPVCDWVYTRSDLGLLDEVEEATAEWHAIRSGELFERANRAVGNEWKSSLPGVER